MPKPNLQSTKYIVGFATALCGVCAIFVASAAVGLKDKQERNKIVDRQSKVLAVAGLMVSGEKLSDAEIAKRYEENISARVIDLSTGAYVDDVDATTFDARQAAKDPARSKPAPQNAAKVMRLPEQAIVYQVVKSGGGVEKLIIPISGYGLWSTMYGFLALEADARTIAGITFYEHGETPGLGGEIENPRWQAQWIGRKAFDAEGQVAIKVSKGNAGPPEEDPHRVDSISGATITSRGVEATLAFWLSKDAFGPYIERFRAQGGTNP